MKSDLRILHNLYGPYPLTQVSTILDRLVERSLRIVQVVPLGTAVMQSGKLVGSDGKPQGRPELFVGILVAADFPEDSPPRWPSNSDLGVSVSATLG